MPRELGALQPRARGAVRLSVDAPLGRMRLAALRQSGSLRALFPRTDSRAVQAVLTNTSGGVTGGDRFRTEVAVSEGAELTVTTQAAERAYRAQPGETGRVETTLDVTGPSRLNWLPQETILYDGCAFHRRLSRALDTDSAALVVEPVIFGRGAMGERVTSGSFDDRIEIRRGGKRLLLDRTRLSGNPAEALDRPGVAAGAGAMALVAFAAPLAEAKLAPLRALLPGTAGASLLRPDLLVARLLARDAFDLRQTLLPVIDLLHDDTLPRPWMI
jgi:urease accessory protein